MSSSRCRLVVAWVTLAGCDVVGDLVQDRCEVLCREVGDDLAACQRDAFALTWSDLGADDKTSFINQCQDDWARERVDLTASDLRRALDDCDLTLEALDANEIDCPTYATLLGEGL